MYIFFFNDVLLILICYCRLVVGLKDKLKFQGCETISTCIEIKTRWGLNHVMFYGEEIIARILVILEVEGVWC